ncbi:glyoxylate/hydroxypyruvate reductase A [Acidisoma cellulosilytica]|uniref:Glyoxylate/hydroxypyruvate reductase A n=1 Tax=Acidisoma cellulosilyticum TaxID=2802395 RepID=A0A963Z3G3_9PROT|nr:glyoxylate/hydroxypyruvate reductase A [Acidisoma cellulosilyticum]MCB8882142.1 glyoxylate/hydroxypyruvate reductase A [Acidisoma cellulosilyticum]
MAKPTLLYACPTVPAAPWVAAFKTAMPDLELRVWPEIGDPAEIDYAFVWHPPLGLFPQLTALRAVFSLGAGVERLLDHAEIPAGMPLIRMVEPSLGADMAIYVTMQVLHYHRRMPEFARNQRQRAWVALDVPMARDRKVGILGYGQLGALCAERLSAFGFALSVWSRSPKDAAGLRVFTGRDRLEDFLAESEILVCLLPLTEDTSGILNAKAFAAMPPGSYLINVGRGPHVVEQDLLAALASGQIAHATLDVFAQEPLAEDHPFWRHDQVTVTPHVAARTQPQTAALMITDNIRRHRNGECLLNLVDRSLGY